MKTLYLAAALWLGLAFGAAAQQDDIRTTIRNQLDAFKSEDVEQAFTYASPTIQGIFREPELFGHMVEHGYPMVWKPGAVVFLGLETKGGAYLQTVMIEDAQGTVHLLEYKMIELEGRWQIDGVRLLEKGTVA